MTTFLVVNRDVALCLGQHGSIRLPGGGERGICGRRFKAQPAAMLERRKRLEHTSAELGGHSGREQVGLLMCFYTVGQLRIYFLFLVCFHYSSAMLLPWPARTGCCQFSLPVGDVCFQPSNWLRPCQHSIALHTLSWFWLPERRSRSGQCPPSLFL